MSEAPVKEGSGEAKPGKAKASGAWRLILSARSNWRREIVVLIALLIGGSLLMVTVILLNMMKQKPIIDYDVETSIARITVVDQHELVWNLPTKTLTQSDYSGLRPVTSTQQLGIGAVILPQGTTAQISRLGGQALNIKIVDIGKTAPTLIDGSREDTIPLEKGAAISIAGRQTAHHERDAECPVPLPPLTVRGKGDLIIGQRMHSDTYDPPATLRRITPEGYAEIVAQPTLLSGRALVQGKTPSGEDYLAHEISLQRGDVLIVREDEAKKDLGAPIPSSNEFIISMDECSAIGIRGRAKASDPRISRLGSDSGPDLAVSVWQIISHDRRISILGAVITIVLTAMSAYEGLKKLWASSRREPAPPPAE